MNEFKLNYFKSRILLLWALIRQRLPRLLKRCLVPSFRLLVLITFINVALLFYSMLKPAKLLELKMPKAKQSITKVTFNQKLNCQIIQLGHVTSSQIATVSVYFNFDKSKHSRREYDKWQEFFFTSVTSTPLVVFTDKASIFDLMNHASRSTNPKTFYVFEEIWDITRLIESDRNKIGQYVDNYKNVQYSIDPERHFHSPELYAVWNAKSFLMKYASSEAGNIYSSKFFLYTDIGAFRKEIFANWPDVEHAMEISVGLRDRILFSQVRDSLPDPYDVRGEYIEGGFFAGSSKALHFFYDKFYELHDEFLDLGLFIGKDQMMMNVMVKVRHADKICKLWLESFRTQCVPKKDAWFVYQDYLAPLPTNLSMRLDDRRFSGILSAFRFILPRRDKARFENVPKLCLENRLYHLPLTSISCDNEAEHIAISRCKVCEFNL